MGVVIISLILASIGFIVGWKLSETFKPNREISSKIVDLKLKAESAVSFQDVIDVQSDITNFLSNTTSLSRSQRKDFNKVLEILVKKTKAI